MATVQGPISNSDREHMRHAIYVMRQAGIIHMSGGPFGAIIVLNGKVVGVGENSVIADRDPTAHAEINAIRDACRTLHTHILTGATLYTSCECCPMCYSAAYWARIGKIYFAASWADYQDIFDDSKINSEILSPYSKRRLHPEQLLRDEALAVWDEFRKLPDGARY